MKAFEFPSKTKNVILALGPESAGNFAVYHRGKIHFSDDFGDLLEEKNFLKFQTAILKFLQDNKIKPDIILTDFHPLYKTTHWGAELVRKHRAKHIQVQHHIAHLFSSLGDCLLTQGTCSVKRDSAFYGIALDGTGYGLDEKIWGGEIFKISNSKFLISNEIPNPKSKKLRTERIGHLENQILIGGDLAIKEPARMLISVLSKFLSKDNVYQYAKKHYNRNQFELLYNQLQQNFNCQETSSTGRVLDAVSVLLGFCENERKYKHEPIDLLEKNSTVPYSDLKPKTKKYYNNKSRITNYQLMTTPLFEYLIKNRRKNKKRLAATAQLYIAQGLQEIVKLKAKSHKLKAVFLSGGIANNKIVSSHLESKGVYVSKKIPRGDAGISFGQIIYYLLTNSRN